VTEVYRWRCEQDLNHWQNELNRTYIALIIHVENYCLFSYAGIITRPHRRCMAYQTFEKLLLLKEI